MSPSPQRGSSRFAPRIAQSLSPPTRSSASPSSNTVGAARSGIPSATGARPSLSAFTSAGSASASASARTPAASSRSVSAESAASTAHAFRTISAGTFRNNNPFAQRLQLAFTPASRSSGVQAQEGITAEIGMISSSPIYDRQRSQPDVDMSASSPATPHTPPLHIVKSANLKSKTSTSTPNSSAEKVSGIPQPYTSRFNSPSLFTPPPGGASRSKSEARLVSPTLDIPEPRAHQHQPPKTGRAGSESPSPAAALSGRHAAGTGMPMASASAGQAVRKSRFINQPRSPEDGRGGQDGLQVSGLPNTHAGTVKQKKPGVQRKTVPTLSPDISQTSAIPRARSPGQGTVPRKSSPSTLSPPSFHQNKNARSLRQPSVPVLRGGGGGGQVTTNAQNRRRASSTSSLSQSAGQYSLSVIHGNRLEPALPIVGRKDKAVEVIVPPSSPPPTRGETGNTTAPKGHTGMTRSRSKSLVAVTDSPDTRLRQAAAAASARMHTREQDRVAVHPSDLDVPEHIRFRLRTLHQLSRVLGFDQSDVAQEIDIPGLLGRVDRAVEKHKDVVTHADERAELRSHEVEDAFARTVHSHDMSGCPSVQEMAEALKHDWTAELKRTGGGATAGEDDTILGSPLELLPADAPFDVWPKSKTHAGTKAKELAPSSMAMTMSRSASQRSILDIDMATTDGRFGASPSLSFATFGLGLTVADWNDEGGLEHDDNGSPLLRLDQAKLESETRAASKGSKKKDWRSGVMSRFKSLGRKSVDGPKKDRRQGGQSDSEDDEEFWEGQTDRKRKAATVGVWDVPAFGLALTDVPLDAWRGVHLDGEVYHVPLAASICIGELWERGISAPGLFRLAGTEDQVERTYTNLNTPPFYGLGSDLSSSTPYSIAHVLKRFLRDLPEPLLDESLLSPLWSWCCGPDFPAGGLASMTMHPAHSRRISAATLLLRLLPPQHLSLFTYIMAFISHLQCATENRLTLDAIAVVFGPAMLAPRGEGVPGVGAGTKGEKSDPVRVAMLVDQSQKCLAWLVRYWPLIRPELGKVAIQLPAGKPVRDAKGPTQVDAPASPGSPRRGLSSTDTAGGPPVPSKSKLEENATRGNHSLDIPRPSLGTIGRKSGLSNSVSMSSFGLAPSPSIGDMNKKARASSPLASPDIAHQLGGKLKSSGSTASGLGTGLRSALSNMNLSAAYKDEEGLKVPKRSASFNNLSAVLKKGIGLGKSDKKSKTLSSTPSTPGDSPLLLTPNDSPDLGSGMPRSSLSCDGRPSSLFSTTSIANSQVSSVLGSLQDLLSSKDRQIERDARELAVLRHTLLEMNSKLSALSHAMPASPAKKDKSTCGCEQRDTPGSGDVQPSPIIMITQSPSVQQQQLDGNTDELITDLRLQLDNVLAALAVSRETTLTKDKQLVSIHQTLARHRAERLSESNRLESQLLIEVAKNKGLREERDLAKVRLEKVKHELFKVM